MLSVQINLYVSTFKTTRWRYIIDISVHLPCQFITFDRLKYQILKLFSAHIFKQIHPIHRSNIQLKAKHCRPL